MLERRDVSMQLLVGAPGPVAALTGISPPMEPMTSAHTSAGLCLWLSPRQWLLIGGSLEVRHAGSAAVLDAGSRWTLFELHGDDSAAVINAGCGLDLRAHRFPIGHVAQTRIDQVPAIVHRRDHNHFDVLVERPLAHYFQMWLEEQWQNQKA